MVINPLWIDNGDGEGPVRNPELTDAEFEAELMDAQASNVAALWQSAYDYEFAQISGTAVGLLAAGVQKGGPVALAIQAWCFSIWNLYYQRKPQVTHEWNAALLDFSSCGEIPHSIPDLMAEVLG